MAFDKTPSQDTYQTKMVEIFYQTNNRGTNASADEDYVNVFIELVKNKEVGDQDSYIVKRAGSSQYIASVGASTVRGSHYNEDFKKYYYVVGNTMYIWNVATGTLSTSIAAFFGTTTGDVGFCDYLYDNGTAVVIATDGTTLKQIDSANVVTASVDPDMPVHIPTPVFLDGYLFLLKVNTADLYNSDLNNPLSWTPGNFINAEIDADIAKGVYKLNNYLVVFGTKTIEYFWDGANATGSPLVRNDTPVKFNGMIGGVAQQAAKIYFVGNDITGQPEVYVLEDFKIEALSDQSLIRYLAGISTDPYVNWKGTILSVQGHDFYVLNAGSLSYVMDLTTKLWTRWDFQTTGSFQITTCINTKDAGVYRSLFCIDGDSTIYRMNPSVYQDVGVNFVCSGVTDNEYFDTMKRKNQGRLTVWADRPSSNTNMTIQYSDDDYLNYSTARNVNLNQDRPSLERFGQFRRRAFKWTYSDNFPFRMRAMEIEINIGRT